MKIKAFTLIELLVVVSIIAIVSVAGGMTFFDFLKGRELNSKINEVTQSIKNQDNKVASNSIFDYRIIFNTQNNTYYYLYENFFDSYNNITFNTSLNQLESESLDNNSTWQINIFENGKLRSSIQNNTDTYSFTKDININYKFENNISIEGKKIPLNSIEIINFENIKEELEGSYFFLQKISLTENGSDIGNLEIENIGGKKEFYSNGSIIDKVYLYFEKDGINKFTIRTKN